jgi:RimJ/RimL family protein N-acetyltransferase
MYAGDLVTLRAREPEDAAALAAWHADPEAMRWWDRVYPAPPAEVFAERTAAAAPMSYANVSFTIVALDTRAAIGSCGLFEASPEHRHAYLGVMIGDAAYRGRGYGTDATRTLCRFGFDAMGLVRIALTVFPENVAGRRTYERLGFAEEGVQRQAEWKRGVWHDLVHLAVFPDTLR